MAVERCGGRIAGVALGVFLAAAVLRAAPATGPGAPRGPGAPGAGGLAQLGVYQDLLQQARAAGVDTAEAQRLDRLSRSAARENREEASRLIAQAIDNLRAGLAAKGVTPAAAAPRGAAAKTGSAPVFLVAFTHHYSGPGGYYATPDEVRKMGQFFVKHGIPGTLFFDGILVERLEAEAPDLLRQVREWNLPIGYHGEETHGPYPVGSDLMAEVRTLPEAQGYRGTWSLTTGRDWATAVRLVTERYSHAVPYRIDPQTRMLDRRTETASDLRRAGGIARVRQAIGKDVSMIPSHALESAPVGLAFRRMSDFLLDQPAVPVALHALRIFRAEEQAEAVMGIAGAEPSLFWFMGRVMGKGDDNGEAGWRLGPLRQTIERLDRSQPRLLLVGFSSFDEADAARTAAYVRDEFMPANPGSGWVSGETLGQYIEGEKDFALSPADLDGIAQALIEGWNGRPPDFVRTAARVYSLCDAFDALASALAETARAGRLPAELRLKPLYGPVLEDERSRLGGPTRVSAAAVATAATGALRAADATPAERFVPAATAVGAARLNAAELLYALAAAHRASRAGAPGEITVPPSTVFPPYADVLQRLFTPRATQPLCYTKGQLWTVKPVRARGAAAAAPSPSAAPAPTAMNGRLLAVFAANLDSDRPCYREQHDGADLYAVDFDLASQRASGLRRLTRREGQAEWFPALSPDGAYVVCDYSTDRERGAGLSELHAIGLARGSDTRLVDQARFAAFDASGRWLYYSAQRPGAKALCRVPVQAGSDGLAAGGAPVVIADQRAGAELVEDPAPFPDGSAVVFHRKETDSGAGLASIGTDGTGLAALTAYDGCGHAAVSPDGKAVACTRSRDGAIIVIRRGGDGAWQAPRALALSTAAADYAKLDARFGQVSEARHSYVEWVAPDLLIVTTHGSPGGREFRFARVFLLRVAADDSVTGLIDFSGAVERCAGKSGKDFCSADAMLRAE